MLTETITKELSATSATLPIAALLPSLFTDPKMFGSYRRFSAAGFSLVVHAPHKMMAGTHDLAPGYIFKKFNDDKNGQIVNYLRRIEGARLLRAFIADRGFTRVVCPRKWLYELPSSFPHRYLVVAERLRLVGLPQTERAYGRIGKTQTRELATVLYYFRGLNSTASNLPYTKDDKIAFIDTERWHHKKDFLRKVGDRLPAKRRQLAEKIYDELRRQGARPLVTTIE